LSQLASGVGYPAPEANLAASPIWRRETIEEWARETGRTLVENDDG
jgi:hypothetical protein